MWPLNWLQVSQYYITAVKFRYGSNSWEHQTTPNKAHLDDAQLEIVIIYGHAWKFVAVEDFGRVR